MPPNYYADPQVHLIAARQSDGTVQSVAGLSKGRYLSDRGCSSARHTRLFPSDSCCHPTLLFPPFYSLFTAAVARSKFPSRWNPSFRDTVSETCVTGSFAESSRGVWWPGSVSVYGSLRINSRGVFNEWRPCDLEEIPLNSYKSFAVRCFVITQHYSYREIVQPRWLSRIYGMISRYSGFNVAGSQVKRSFHRVQRQLQINQEADNCYQKQDQTRKQKL